MASIIDTVNLYLYEGSAYVHQMPIYAEDGTPVTLVGYAAKMQIRDRPDESGTLYHEATTANGELIIDPSGANSGLETAAVTMNLPGSLSINTFSQAFYDLFLIASDGAAYAVARGQASIQPRTTII